MKRKKWSELEELTLLSKYSELLRSGALAKLKTREKKFKPVADHVNSLHHLRDPVTFPFRWSWRDVSIKVQNMRHQYLGVKQKIRVSSDRFNWNDGENHWENFLKYKEVFGDVDLDPKPNKPNKAKDTNNNNNHLDVFGDYGDLGFGNIGCSEDEEEEEEEEDEDEEADGVDDDDEDDDENGDDTDVGEGEAGAGGGSEGEFRGRRENGELGLFRPRTKKKLKKKSCLGVYRRRLGSISAQVLELREAMVKREERRREREFRKEKGELEREGKRREAEFKREKRRSEREEWLENRELELEERQLNWGRRELEKRLRLERELKEERRWRKRMEEKMEEGEMEWRERMMAMQIEHEKQMMQMHADACQNQMQILGIMARLVCQFFGSANDGLGGGGLGALPPQVLQNLQHTGGLGNVKPDANSPSEFI